MYVCTSFPFNFEGGTWDLIVLVPDHCLSINFEKPGNDTIGIINFERLFSKFYHRHYKLVSKFKVGLKSLLQQGLSEPEFYGDLVYKLRKIVSRADFSDQLRKVIMRYKRIRYNINVMQQSACLVMCLSIFPFDVWDKLWLLCR